MKIALSPEQSPFDRRTALNGGVASSSFAQLLEGGTQARAVLSHRALSFAEAGILGVHFGQSASRAPIQFAAAGEYDAKTGEPAAAQPADISVLAGSIPAAIEQGVAGAEAPASGPLPGLSGRNRAIATPLARDRLAAARVVPEGPIEDTHLAPARPPAPPPTRRRSPLHVRLLGDSAELVVAIEGLPPGDESISELEATARTVASEYCVGISRLFVKPNGNGSAA